MPRVASGKALLIDDFEDADLLLAPSAHLQGVWYVHNDGTGTQSPPADDQEVAAQLIAGSGSEHSPAHALHTSGEGFHLWGAFAAARLNSGRNQVCSLDLAAYSRLKLSARGRGSVRFNLGTSATTPVEDGGTCHQEACSDFGASIELSEEWRDITLELASLTQPDWATPAELDPQHALRLSFWAEGSDFDFWIDDLRFRE
jgi:hypothetical protein